MSLPSAWQRRRPPMSSPEHRASACHWLGLRRHVAPPPWSGESVCWRRHTLQFGRAPLRSARTSVCACPAVTYGSVSCFAASAHLSAVPSVQCRRMASLLGMVRTALSVALAIPSGQSSAGLPASATVPLWTCRICRRAWGTSSLWRACARIRICGIIPAWAGATRLIHFHGLAGSKPSP